MPWLCTLLTRETYSPECQKAAVQSLQLLGLCEGAPLEQVPPPPPTEVRWFKGSAMTFLSALPVICFSFQGHISAIPLYAEMRHRTLRNFDLVIGLGLAICIVIYNLTGWVGYLSFGDDTASDILVNLSTKSPLVNIARLCVALAVATSYAILHFCARKVLLDHFGAFCSTRT